MSDPQGIEDVLSTVTVVGPTAVVQQADALAAANLPLVDRERGIAVIRLDPELAEELAGWSCPQWECGHPDCKMLRRAARIIGWEQSDDG